MRPAPKPFNLYERKRPGKPSVWYARFRAADGKFGSPVCTDLAEKNKASEWAYRKLLEAKVQPSGKPAAVSHETLFREWATSWWLWPRGEEPVCKYIREKLADGYQISRAYADSRRSYLNTHLLPEFGKIPVSQLTPAMFRDYKLRLFAEGRYKPGTINKILGTARIMFSYAFNMGEIPSNPMAAVKELKETPVERGILSVEELKMLFAPAAVQSVWNSDLRYHAMNLLAASGGLRIGECQALQVQYVHPDYVEVRYSWDDRFGRSAPKWGSVRIVPIPTRTAAALSDLLALNRWGDPLPTDVVFWSRDRDTPLSKTAILDSFKAALLKIGISEEERRRRSLVFHGYRHLFNTLVRGQVPDEQLRRVTGHKAIGMTDNYDHAGAEQLRDVLAVQEKIFARQPPAIVPAVTA